MVFQLFPLELFQGRQTLGVASFGPLARAFLVYLLGDPKGHRLNVSLVAGRTTVGTASREASYNNGVMLHPETWFF